MFPSSQRRGGRAINKTDPFHPGRGFFGGFATFIDAAAFPFSARRGMPELNF